jgi:predicted secreted protein
MGAQKGKDLLLKMNDGTAYVTVAGLRSRKIAFNAGTSYMPGNASGTGTNFATSPYGLYI